MKKSILSMFLFAMLMISACTESKINEDQVPGAVVNSFKTKYPTATATKWITEKKDGKTIYEAIFKNGSEEIEAEFNEDGSFIKEH